MTKKDKFYFISINMLKDKHKDIIEWIKKQSDEQESSISSFCINLIKREYNRGVENGKKNKVVEDKDNRGNTEDKM